MNEPWFQYQNARLGCGERRMGSCNRSFSIVLVAVAVIVRISVVCSAGRSYLCIIGRPLNIEKQDDYCITNYNLQPITTIAY
jgi:hypothetical protein